MAYYNICPDCKAHLDPGERCDCRENRKEKSMKRETARIIYNQPRKEKRYAG